jgi:hypothetical protein
MYPWPIGNFDYVMDDALDIALNYLTLTGQAVIFQEVQSTAATAIAAAWRGGVRRRIRLVSLMPRSKRSKVRKPDRFSNNRIAAAGLEYTVVQGIRAPHVKMVGLDCEHDADWPSGQQRLEPKSRTLLIELWTCESAPRPIGVASVVSNFSRDARLNNWAPRTP